MVKYWISDMRDTRIINPDYNYPYEHQSSVGDILQVGDGSGMSSQPPTVSKTSSLSPPDVYLHFLPAILDKYVTNFAPISCFYGGDAK